MTMEVDLFSKLMLTEEERVVDPQLGYPLGYAKLCRHASLQLHGLFTPFTEGPPHRFLPYSPQSEDFATLKEWDGLFPTVANTDRDPENARKYAEELWQQLDHLGNAGFDPAKFRVDPYGNVVYRHADPSSPLAWEIDHWFPHSRGGKTVVTNLRVVQWQANQRKKNRLEFLVPWWDLQHGCSINQFLSAFASKNADFRKRSFALFFSGGEDESVAREHVGDCRPWPQQFREKKAQCGLAAAAIVMVHKENDEAHRPCVPFKSLLACDAPSAGMQAKRRWSAEEEEALRRAVNKFGSGSWKEMKENEPALANRSTVQLKEKCRLMRVDWLKSGKENMLPASTGNCRSDHLDRQSSATTTLQKELRVKIMREEEKREKETEIAELEKTVLNLKQQNEKERLHAVELETVLTKHKRAVEKQRRWAETQSSYRLCLERMIRDTMHQSISYKEQARLNQSACNALKARLDCQKVVCEAAEKDLLQNYTQRGILEATVEESGLSDNSLNTTETRSVVQGRDIVDVSSCVSLRDCEDGNEVLDKKTLLQDINLVDSDSEDETADEVYSRRTEHRRKKDLLHESQQEEHAWKSLDNEVADDAKLEKHEAADALPMKVSSSEESLPDCSTQIVGNATVSEQEAVPETEGPAPLRLSEENRGSKSLEFVEVDLDQEHQVNISHEVRRDDIEHVNRQADADVRSGFEAPQVCTARTELRTERDGMDLEETPVIYDHAQCPDSGAGDDIHVPSAGVNKLSDLKQVKKNVIVVQSENTKAEMTPETIEKEVVYNEEYLDELLQHVQFQLPSLDAADAPVEDNPLRKSEEHLDELLQQVLATHIERIRKTEAGRQQACDTDDEKVRQIGKQNLDKWLQVLLFNVESAGPSPGQDSPLHRAFSPALTQMSIAAMRGNLNLEANQDQEISKKTAESVERPKGLWGVLLRKLSARQQSEQCLSNKLDAEADNEAEVRSKTQGIASYDQPYTTQVLNERNITSSGIDETSNTSNLAHDAQRCSDYGKTLRVDSTRVLSDISETNQATMVSNHSIIDPSVPYAEDGVPKSALDQHFTIERRHYPRALSDLDEISEADSNDTSDSRQLENKDPNKNGLRASIKAAGLVWKKAVKKLETRLQDGSHPMLE
ncbi:hypothetical protein M758_10G154000 [Ceratodon purpureus]|nr:hypothetical protein M758_10G154000 [Ceratodon purpureus]